MKHDKTNKIRRILGLKNSISSRRLDAFIVLILFIFALLLRLHFLNAGLFYIDAVTAATNTEETYNTGVLHYMHASGYPGYVITLTASYSIFKFVGIQSTEFLVLFSSAFFASLSIGVIYIFVKKLSGSKLTALSAALILNFLPVYLSASTMGMSNPLAAFFILLSFYLVLLASEKKSRMLLVLASLSFGWAAACRLESFILLPIFILLYWQLDLSNYFYWKKLKKSYKILEIIKVFAFLLVPAFIILLTAYLPIFLTKNGFQTILDGIETTHWLGPAITQQLIDTILAINVSLTLFGWILAAIGIVFLFRRKQKFILFAVIIWCAYLFIYANINGGEDRHAIVALIGFSVAMGFGVEFFYKKINKILAIIVLSFILISMFAVIYPIIDYRSSFCGPKSFALNLSKIIEKNSIVITSDESAHLQYYGNLSTMVHPSDGNMQKINENLIEINKYLENGTNVYLTAGGLSYDSAAGIVYDPITGKLFNEKTHKIYNLTYYRQIGAIAEPTSGLPVLLTGVWELEFFTSFQAVPITYLPNDDWHRKTVKDGRYTAVVFKVIKKL
ncbi:MAG: phospholipid carrier-dependent glycosyltransferase [Candidatus Aenigmarchaeota archaeon]|nr:phospholipid carrier-dependent glycosyltransferase [Candidatus Aenigmarchaeota archaeon]